jgi:hypothetical protein
MATLERLNMRSAELDEELKETQNAITECERFIQIQNNSTKEEVFRLKGTPRRLLCQFMHTKRHFASPLDKLEGIQDLHMWKATKVNARMAQFLYAGRFSISIPCANFAPIASRVAIDRLPLPGKRQDPFPALSDLTLKAAVKWVQCMGDPTTIHEVSASDFHREIAENTGIQIVAFLSDYWTSIVQLRAQLDIIQIAYPVKVEVMPQDGTTDDLNASTSSTGGVTSTIPSFKAVVKTVDLAMGSKVLIDFLFDFGVFAHWPMTLKRTKCEVKVVMGPFRCVFYPMHQRCPP